jgi:predicted nucleotidyltransferase
VEQALRAWAAEQAERRPELVRLGYFGSYARGDWGVGSDLDVVAIVAQADLAFQERGARWPVERLPVSTDLLVYTEREWDELQASGSRFAATVGASTVWVYP